MFRTMCKSKIHRATVTGADLNYIGSITIDPVLMEAADLLEFEQVAVVNVNNGARFETYVIPGERGKGEICLNGAAARDRKSTRLNSSHSQISYAVFCLKKKKKKKSQNI